ncbi:MAG TPA: 4Fe-4S binding protein [Firmicutes bacterium]|nr:4Fe-4S binding protein [Bacillota bacterium]
MALSLEPELCAGCPGAAEPPCAEICPGDLLVREGGRVRLREAGDCWGCASCVKACPRGALSLVLPAELGGRGSRLSARVERGRVRWTLRRWNGDVLGFTTGEGNT